MAANEHLQPRQLQMFMPAHQLLASHDLHDADDQGERARSEMLAYKHEQNLERQGGRGYGDFTGGIRTPLHIHHGPAFGEGAPDRQMLVDGHHRLMHALHTNQNTELPLRHFENEEGFA